ncbi:MAG TPA: 50S ribosomal protein L32 [Limnochordia bacterium]|nr:50S ribosomal protein L32 [Limnochordia bacterium]
MANPKRRHSKARTRTRRATWKTAGPVMTRCPQCHEPKLPHRVCPHCGSYRGRTVVSAGAES